VAPDVDDLTDFAPHWHFGRESYPVAGKVRTAAKQHRCVCADDSFGWQVEHTRVNGNATGYFYFRDGNARERAEECADRVQTYPGYTGHEINPIVNPRYRPECLCDINPGDRYFEFLEDTPEYQSGERFCARCARATFANNPTTKRRGNPPDGDDHR